MTLLVILAGLLIVSAGSVFLAWLLCQPSANGQQLAPRDRMLRAIGDVDRTITHTAERVA